MNDTSSNSNRVLQKGNHGKLYFMMIFLAIDLGLNSSLDYDSVSNADSFARLGLFGFQLVVQISIFLMIFLTIADTFLFRVGLLNILVRKVRGVLVMQLAYFVLTILLGMTKMQFFADAPSSQINGAVMADAMKDKTYVALSIVHKIVAVLYYILNIQMTMKLEDPIYYNQAAWIALIKEQRKQLQQQL